MSREVILSKKRFKGRPYGFIYNPEENCFYLKYLDNYCRITSKCQSPYALAEDVRIELLRNYSPGDCGMWLFVMDTIRHPVTQMLMKFWAGVEGAPEWFEK